MTPLSPSTPSSTSVELVDLEGPQRDRAIPVIRDSFTGIYRWHAKRTLRDITHVRGAEVSGELVGVSMLERLAPEVGYVYYLAVLSAVRGHGIGARLLDDALERFARDGITVVYAAAEVDNVPSRKLFASRGFREVERHEPSYREGGLGAWGLRSRMRVVPGEVLLGRRLTASATDNTEAARSVEGPHRG